MILDYGGDEIMDKIIEIINMVAKKSNLVDIIKIEKIPFSIENLENGIYTDIIVCSFDCEAINTIYYFLAEVVMYLPAIETKIVSYNVGNDLAKASVEICYIE